MTQAESITDGTSNGLAGGSPPLDLKSDAGKPANQRFRRIRAILRRFGSFFDRAADGLERIWRFMRDVWSLLRTVRFAVLSLLVYLLLLWSPQGVDSMLTLLDRPVWQWVLINYFAIQVWQWSRLMVTYRYLPLDRRDIDGDALDRMLEKSKQDLDEQRVRYGSSPEAASNAGVDLERLETAHHRLQAKVESIREQNDRRHQPDEVARLQFWMMWLPRLLGGAVYLLAARALYVAAAAYGGLRVDEKMHLLLLSVLMLANGCLFVVFAWRRRELVNGLVRAWLRPDWLVAEMREKDLPTAGSDSTAGRPTKEELERLSPGGRLAWRAILRKGRFMSLSDSLAPGRARRLFANIIGIDSSRDLQDRWRWHDFSDLHRNTRNWLRGLAALATAAFLVTLLFPAWSEQFGPIGNVAIPLAFWTMLGSVLVWLFDHRRVPLVIPLFLWGLVTNVFLENHDVRTLDAASVVPTSEASPRQRPGVETFVATQLAQRPDLSTPVIVATAGGGIRAAYWTATALSALDAKAEAGGFRRNLLAISAVSGGGLGAAAYLAATQSAASARFDLQGRLDAFLAHDFLAPTVGALVGRDLVYRLFPLYAFEDRAAALERSWERAWDEEFARDGRFASGYWGYHQAAGGTSPALLINGASVATGERIITSPFIISWEAFREAHDFFTFNGERDIPLSTAVSNGARFPLVSPAGTLRDREGNALGQIVDGGYFENFGAETALDFLRVLCDARPAKPQGCGEGRMQPIVIQISSDPALATPDPNAEASRAPLATQIFAPVATFLNTRDARGESAMRELEAETVQRYSGIFVHIRLFRSPKHEDPPLGWVLSSAARQTIRSNLALKENQDAFARVIDRLHTTR
jgi:hypothetical protein